MRMPAELAMKPLIVMQSSLIKVSLADDAPTSQTTRMMPHPYFSIDDLQTHLS
jgi:hypothetical protein